MRILIETTLHHLIYHNYTPRTEVILDDFGAEKTLHHPTYLKYTPISAVVLGRLANSYSSVGIISSSIHSMGYAAPHGQVARLESL